MDKKELANQGKKLAYCLRHAPGDFGVTLKEDGSTSVDSVLIGLKLTREELETIVNSDDKGRFIIEQNRIWATQGHSAPVSVPLKVYTELAPLYHGTKTSFVESILSQGLTPKTRNHVHLSLDLKTAETVSARRNGETTILKIDAAGMLFSGFLLFISENGVVLTESVPPEFITIVES